MQLLLKWNGYILALKTGELADLFIAMVDEAGGSEKLLDWLKQHLR